jgi:hypothetical protein
VHTGIHKGPLVADSRRSLQPVIPVFSFEETREARRKQGNTNSPRGENKGTRITPRGKGYVARLNFEEKTKHRPVAAAQRAVLLVAPLKKGFCLFKPDSERVETSFGVVT